MISPSFKWLLLCVISYIFVACAHFQHTHVVQKGETLWRIAQRYQVEPVKLTSLNDILENQPLPSGKRLRIPTRGGASADVSNPLPPQETRFAWPVKGEISSHFGSRWGGFHDGIDISAPEGSLVRAAQGGKVIYSGHEIRGYGNLIVIRHPHDWISVYAHNKVNLVKKGVRIQQGQVIARIGKTGRTTGPHLHFELRVAKKARDPAKYLP